MKKSVWRQVGIVLLAVSALFLGACKQDGNLERSSNIDVYTLEAVDITAKAYPGFNYIAWGETIYDDCSYHIYRDDGKEIENTDKNFYIDTDIKDGVSYTYTIYTYAEPDQIVKDADVTSANYSTYYVVKGSAKSTTVKAIRPDYYSNGKFVSALDLANYEAGGNKNYVVSQENIIFNVEKGGLRVAFPTKAYLKYSLSFYKGNAYEVFTEGSIPAEDILMNNQNNQFVEVINNTLPSNFYKMDGTYSKSFTITSAGTYQAVITVEGFDGTMPYVPSYVVSKPVTIEQLEINKPTAIAESSWIDDGKTARIAWHPATKNNDTVYAAESYKIYLKDSNNVYTDIAATIKADKKNGETIYYADYAIADNSVDYEFYVVLSENGKVEDNSTNSKKAVIGRYGTVGEARRGWGNAYFVDYDRTDIINDAVLEIKVPDIDVTVGAVKYRIVNKNANTDDGDKQYVRSWLYNDSEFTAATVVPVDYTTYRVMVPNVALDSKVVFLYSFKENGRADSVDRTVTGIWHDENNDGDVDDEGDWLEETYASIRDFDIGNEFVFEWTNTDGYENKGIFGVIAADDNDDNYTNYLNYTYEIYYARILDSSSVKDLDKVTTNWTKVPVTIAWDADAAQYQGVSSEITFTVDTPVYETELDADGKEVIGSYVAEYAFKYVKTNKNAPAGTPGASVVEYTEYNMSKPK